VRSNNEDSFLCLQFDASEVRYLGRLGDDALERGDFVFAVSDGMGGARAGEFASRIAVEKITRRLPPAYRQAAGGLEAGFDDVLTELFHDVHRALLFLGDSYEECSGMGATLSLCWFRPGWMFHAHIGDSRIYYLPANHGTLKQLTQDDTYVGWLYRNAKLNEREARQHPAKNSLQKALGAGHQFVDPQLGAVAIEPGDRFLLCSDGVVDGLFDAQIEEFLREPGCENPAHRIVEAAVTQSGRDNTTALIIDVL
jgi:protein phosphatase